IGHLVYQPDFYLTAAAFYRDSKVAGGKILG
ncbi:unnamed protein product, partial [marine sediment metagenome]